MPIAAGALVEQKPVFEESLALVQRIVMHQLVKARLVSLEQR